MKKIIFFFFFCITITAAAQEVVEDRFPYEAPAYNPEKSGRHYYDHLIHEAVKRHWAIPVSLSYTYESGGFNCDGCSGSLAGTIFGKDSIRIKDVYLFSKLSCENKVRINNCDAKDPVRGDVFIGRAGVPFGGFADDLYTTLLGPVRVAIDADQREFCFVPSIIFHYDFGEFDQYAFAAGFSVPLKSKQHIMALSFVGGELFRDGFVPDTTQRETSLRQFFRDYTSVEDFFFRAVLAPKGLTFDPIQRTAGLGDVSFFSAFEYHGKPYIEIGWNIVFPTAGKGDGCSVWEPILGNGGAFQFEPFLQIMFMSKSPYLNPFFRIAGQTSASFTANNIRVPVLVTNDMRQQVKNVAGLDHPSFFDDFYVDPFSEFDTCVPLFANNRLCMKQKIGSKVIIGVGNYAYDIFHESFRWGIFYDYMYKTRDAFTPPCCDDTSEECCFSSDEIDTCTLQNCSFQVSHALSTNLTYKFNNLFEIGLGGQFVILGKNVPRSRTLFLNVTFVF